MDTFENIEKIGYYKYETSNQEFSYMCQEYPLTEEVVNYIRRTNHLKLELEDNNLRSINGKFVVLI